MWQLTSKEKFLFYDCAPELVVYNKATRSTSLLPPVITQIFSLFKDTKYNGVTLLDIQKEMDNQFNIKIDLDDVKESMDHLKELILIEYCE